MWKQEDLIDDSFLPKMYKVRTNILSPRKNIEPTRNIYLKS